MKMIALDLDGVLADLETGLENILGFTNLSNKAELFGKALPEYVTKFGFEIQPKMDMAEELVQEVLEMGTNICILTSIGKFADLSEVTRQKKKWVETNFPELKYVPFIATTSGIQKSEFAHKNCFLIDDHENNCVRFLERGGKSFCYTPQKLPELITALSNFYE